MEKKINTQNNNLVIAGHLSADANVSESGKRARITVIRNQGKDSDPVAVTLVIFPDAKGNLNVEGLKKGAAVRVAAFARNADFVNKDTGETVYGTQFVVKDIEFTKKGEEDEKAVNNDFTLEGHLAADAKTLNGGAVSFVVMRNQGANRKPVTVRFTMFAKRNGKDVEVPVENLKKGAAVRVHAYLQANNLVNEETGEKSYQTSYVVKNVEFITKEAEPATEEAAADEK